MFSSFFLFRSRAGLKLKFKGKQPEFTLNLAQNCIGLCAGCVIIYTAWGRSVSVFETGEEECGIVRILESRDYRTSIGYTCP